MGIVWTSYKSKREEKAKKKRLQNENRFHIPDSQRIPEGSRKTTLQMKDKNLPLRENINLDEIKLHKNEEWKLPYKNLRPIKDNQCLQHNDATLNEATFSELKTKLEAWQFYQFKTQHPLDKWTVSSLPNLYFTDM